MPTTDPLSAVTDAQLQQLQLALTLTCGRSRQTYRRQRQGWFCFLFRVLDVERANRGLPPPPANAHAGDLKPFEA